MRALSLVTCAHWCRFRCMWRCCGVVSAVRARGLPGGCPYLLQDVWVCLPEVVEGAEEASLDAGHVLPREVGVVLGGDVRARPQQRHGAGCHHVRAELWGGGAWGGGSPAVRGGLPLLGAQRDLPQTPVRGDPPGPLGPLGKAIHRPTKARWRAACPRTCVPTCPRGGGRPARPPWCTCRGLGGVGWGA